MGRIRRIRPEYRTESSWRLLHDNAPNRPSLVVRQILAKNNVCALGRLPYSPDLSPCDISLFPKLKMKLKGCYFGDILILQVASTHALQQGRIYVWAKWAAAQGPPLLVEDNKQKKMLTLTLLNSDKRRRKEWATVHGLAPQNRNTRLSSNRSIPELGLAQPSAVPTPLSSKFTSPNRTKRYLPTTEKNYWCRIRAHYEQLSEFETGRIIGLK
ncbi:mariner Mos1 transposase [Trichonephila clavipes]|nr:mariner Mos1 transposase [Trichonephila clavipes]